MSSRAKLLTALAVAVAAALVAVLLATLLANAREESSPQAAPKPDLPIITEDMLLDEADVPPVAGTSWGTIVAAAQGGAAPVVPAQCSVFLGQVDAALKGLALRSANGTALGVEVAVPRGTDRPDLSTLVDQCATFTLDAPGTRSTVDLEVADPAGLPPGALRAVLHCRADRGGDQRSWDVAIVIGYHRGLLVSAQYTPGPDGGAFDDQLAAEVPRIYQAQLDRLDAA